MNPVAFIQDESVRKRNRKYNPKGIEPNSIEHRFRAFHRRHPEVYATLVRKALALKDRGFAKYGIKALIEVTRWHMAIKRGPEDDFKINNDFASRYARLIDAQEPELAGFFTMRGLTSL